MPTNNNHIKIIANNPNGININDKVGSTHLELLIKTVREENYDIGFAFDGDGLSGTHKAGWTLSRYKKVSQSRWKGFVYLKDKKLDHIPLALV